MNFEPLTKAHVSQLLDFELNNKVWFESLIAARDDDFYCLQGVTKHIEDSVHGMSNNTQFSAVMIDSGQIIARANLKDIAGSSASVGYRVGQNALSKGVATKCLIELIKTAKELAIKTLKAEVLTNNPASARVLEKQGFIKVETVAACYQLNGETFDCWVFQKSLDR